MDRADEKQQVEIYCCYAHQDQHLLIDLKNHLRLWERQGLMTIRADTDITPGSDWEKEIPQHLQAAQIILLLVSPDFLASDYCYSIEMQRAMERYERGEVVIIPIILRHCAWQEAPFGKIRALPTGATPIVSAAWHNADEAFTDVAQEIRAAVEALRDPNSDYSPGYQKHQPTAQVILIDASLDPQDSPYEQIVERGRKIIRDKRVQKEINDGSAQG